MAFLPSIICIHSKNNDKHYCTFTCITGICTICVSTLPSLLISGHAVPALPAHSHTCILHTHIPIPFLSIHFHVYTHIYSSYIFVFYQHTYNLHKFTLPFFTPLYTSQLHSPINPTYTLPCIDTMS